MTKVKIARMPYQRARKSSLAAFSENVLKRTLNVAAYQAIQGEVEPLPALLTTYRNALVAAHNLGRSETTAKNLAQTALIRQLDAVAAALETLAGEDVQLVIDAGFTVHQSLGLRYSDQLPQPSIVKAESTGKKGEIRLLIDDIVPKAVLTHAVEFSTDQGVTWQNGTYNSYRNFIVKDLPHTRDLWLRLRSIGHGDNKSEWSEIVSVAVL